MQKLCKNGSPIYRCRLFYMKSFKHKTIEVRMQGAFLRFLFKETIISRPVYFYFLDTLGVLGRHSGAKDIVQYTT